jgi:hypothetical protein
LNHLDEAGAQGWELVSVAVAATGDVAIPEGINWQRDITTTVVRGTQVVLVCFKRPLAPSVDR